MFDTPDALCQALTASGVFNGLYSTLMASAPPLAVHTHPEPETTGLEFFERLPHVRNCPISGTITISPDSGTVLVNADGYDGPRWHTALERLATDTSPWAWQPGPGHKPGLLAGVLRLGTHLTAETVINRSRRHTDLAHVSLALTPAGREACETAWSLAVTVLGTLVTGNPAYRSTVLPAPDPEVLTGPATDYPAAISTVAGALAALDENIDFGTARDHDPYWPTAAEGAAVRALRAFRDALRAVHVFEEAVEDADPAPTP